MENAYIKASKARKKDQQKIKDTLSEGRTVEKLNITIPSDYKKRLKEYCDNNYTTPAAFVRKCIDEFC